MAGEGLAGEEEEKGGEKEGEGSGGERESPQVTV